ncbi:MAG: cadherin repeat domain-containing protein [Algibacter sp.]|uniref:cadherin repeat domain-containing protein n=1 Tax=Algibacter sp. TaxID=1872428 RepID=UPI003297D300
MKKNLKTSSFFILTILLFICSCGSEDDSSTSTKIIVKNLVTNFDENPSINEVIGTIQATSNYTLSFRITSQTPSGALKINPSTGELSVADPTVFDFETNPIISASISIIDQIDTASSTATININNLDDIASFLSTSETNYLAAADGEWVIIEEAEYNALANNLNDITKVATSDDDYNAYESSNLNAPTSFTAANNNGLNMPSSSYVFAFKTNNHAVSSTNKVKQSSTSVSDGFIDLGSVLPANIVGTNCFVLKGSNNPTTDVGYLGIYANKSISFKNVAERHVATGPEDVNTLPNSANQIVLYQGLSTTQKQW